MKKLSFPVWLLIITLVLPFGGCQKNADDTDLSALALEQLFGEKKESVLQELGINSEEDILKEEKDESQQVITLKKHYAYKEREAELQLLFQNDIFFGVAYLFSGAAEEAYQYVDSVLEGMEAKYGEPDTYPSLPNRLKNLSFEQLKESGTGEKREIWELADHKNLVEAFLPESEDNGQLELLLSLQYGFPADQPSVFQLTLRYGIHQ